MNMELSSTMASVAQISELKAQGWPILGKSSIVNNLQILFGYLGNDW